MRVLVAMSGGVDSSVAAAMVLEQGHEVIGVTLKQWTGPDGRLPTAGCCTVVDAEDARSVAARLGVAHYVLDYTEAFRTEVVEPFSREYLAGRTPNPCVTCNRSVRFGALAERAAALGCDALATGHHARVRHDAAGWHLLKGADPAKDQSYVLHSLGQEDLATIRFPIGHLSKSEVRARAAELGMRVATKADSQDLCFIGRGGHREFLAERFPEAAAVGPIVDLELGEVGSHAGAAGFTIGQRRGLGVALGEPRFVVEVQPTTNTVVIGRREDLLAVGCTVRAASFVSGSPPAGERIEVKVRYRSAPVGATLRQHVGFWAIDFDEPQEAVAPGQSAVFYDGDEVIGGGTIDEAMPARGAPPSRTIRPEVVAVTRGRP